MIESSQGAAASWRLQTHVPGGTRASTWLLGARALPCGIALLTFLVFSPSLWHGFVEWDDYVNLANNEHFRGLGWTQLKWMFTAILMGHYIPVTWLTFGLDFVLWGMNPAGYHLTNVLLHAANAALFFAVARILLARVLAVDQLVLRLCALAATLFFALHPLRAESVAWATERRDVLSGLFALTTVWLYLRAVEATGRQRIRLLALSVGAYALALASKSIVMTLPLTLIVLDAYPLRRLPVVWRRWSDPALRHVWREKAPYIALAALGALVSWYAVAANAYLTSIDRYPLSARVGFVFYSLAFYVQKTILPIGLSPLYELPYRVDLRAPIFLGAMAAVCLVSLGLIVLRRRWPAGVAVAVQYAIAIAPVSGFVHAGHQLAHDRYSYLSCLGVALLVGAAPGMLLSLQRRGLLRPALLRVTIAGFVLWLATLAVMTVHQVGIWRSNETLWAYAVDADEGCSICHHNLGRAFMTELKAPARAIPHFERVLELRPDREKTHGLLAQAYLELGDRDRARHHLDVLLKAHPTLVDALVNRGLVAFETGQHDEALTFLQRAAAIEGRNTLVLVNLGAVLTRLGRAEEAVAHYLEPAVAQAPDDPRARLTLGLGWIALGRHDKAREQYNVLLEMEHPQARSLARALGDQLIGDR